MGWHQILGMPWILKTASTWKDLNTPKLLHYYFKWHSQFFKQTFPFPNGPNFIFSSTSDKKDHHNFTFLLCIVSEENGRSLSVFIDNRNRESKWMLFSSFANVKHKFKSQSPNWTLADTIITWATFFNRKTLQSFLT